MMLRGHIVRTEPEGADYAPFPPMFTLQEQVAMADRYADWWREFHKANGCAPSRADAARANLRGIGRSNWVICMTHEYCRDAGMLVPPRLGGD